jgi:hypothetical protein
MVTALEHRHVPTGTLAVLAQRLGQVWAEDADECVEVDRPVSAG